MGKAVGAWMTVYNENIHNNVSLFIHRNGLFRLVRFDFKKYPGHRAAIFRNTDGDKNDSANKKDPTTMDKAVTFEKSPFQP
ncbi:MAG: hypothetical protein ACI4LH_01885 [Candidatus Heritagella sp.]